MRPGSSTLLLRAGRELGFTTVTGTEGAAEVCTANNRLNRPATMPTRRARRRVVGLITVMMLPPQKGAHQNPGCRSHSACLSCTLAAIVNPVGDNYKR